LKKLGQALRTRFFSDKEKRAQTIASILNAKQVYHQIA